MTVQPIQPTDHQRPRKQAERAAKRRQQQMDSEAVGIRIDGVDYVINPNDLTGRVEMEIRKEIGMGFAELSARLQTSPGMDYLGMFMWAVRHANGEQVDLMDILDGVSAGSDVEVLTDVEDSAPKARGGSSGKASPA